MVTSGRTRELDDFQAEGAEEEHVSAVGDPRRHADGGDDASAGGVQVEEYEQGGLAESAGVGGESRLEGDVALQCRERHGSDHRDEQEQRKDARERHHLVGDEARGEGGDECVAMRGNEW